MKQKTNKKPSFLKKCILTLVRSVIVICLVTGFFYVYVEAIGGGGAKVNQKVSINTYDGGLAIGGTDAYSDNDRSTKTVDYAYETEAIGTKSANNHLQFRTAENIYLNTNVDSSSNINNTARVVMTKGGYVGIGTSSPNSRLHVNGTIRASDGSSNYHAITKSYVDAKTVITVDNCFWTDRRYYGSDQDENCTHYGSYVQVGMDYMKSHDYIRYNAIYCCQVHF